MFIYTVLLFLTSFNLQVFFNAVAPYKGQPSQILPSQWLFFLITLFASIFMSILYSWMIVNYRRTEIATLKCIGYTNANVRTLIVGEIIWTTLSGFFLVVEIVIHLLAFQVLGAYVTLGLPAQPAPVSVLLPFSLFNLLITLGIFLVVQLFGITLAYRRVLKVRPMQAMRIMQ
jgi:predicted lysophospholipase L1 biosynthesis ABC-type transport system permease subunit